MLDLELGLDAAREAEDREDVSRIRPNWLSAVEISLSKAEIEAAMDNAVGADTDRLPDVIHYDARSIIGTYKHAKHLAQPGTPLESVDKAVEALNDYDSIISVREPVIIWYSNRLNFLARSSELCKTCGCLFTKVSKHEGSNFCHSLASRNYAGSGSYRWEVDAKMRDVTAEEARLLGLAGYKVEKVPTAFKYMVDREVYNSLHDIHKGMKGVSFNKFIKLSGAK